MFRATEATKLAEVIRATLLLPNMRTVIVGNPWSRTLLGAGYSYTTALIYNEVLAVSKHRWHLGATDSYPFVRFRFDCVISDPHRKAYTLSDQLSTVFPSIGPSVFVSNA